MTLETIRDIAVVILAIESIVLGLAALLLIWQVWKLVGIARKKLVMLTDGAGEILDTAKDTAKTVAETARETKGTAAFVAGRTAVPVIELYSAVAGASRFAQAFVRPRKGPPPESPGE